MAGSESNIQLWKEKKRGGKGLAEGGKIAYY